MLPDDDALWDIFEQGHQLLTAAGYQQYETSAYAKPGYQCQHNLNYWRFGDYIGIGCGAHGKVTFPDGRILRTTKTRHPRGFMQGRYLESQRDVEAADKRLSSYESLPSAGGGAARGVYCVYRALRRCDSPTVRRGDCLGHLTDVRITGRLRKMGSCF
ncbi:hypothetical protein ACNKHR_18245 [Shigella flexneri]